MDKVLIINGPNLEKLGARESKYYGHETLKDLEDYLTNSFPDLKIDFFQSNIEGEIINIINRNAQKYKGVVINPGAYTHYSIAIYDSIKASKKPFIEVHISNIYQREEFRRKSVIAPSCIGQISGLGFKGYKMGVEYIKEIN